MKEISGDSRMWLVINTAEYNDGQWAATAANFDEEVIKVNEE